MKDGNKELCKWSLKAGIERNVEELIDCVTFRDIALMQAAHIFKLNGMDLGDAADDFVKPELRAWFELYNDMQNNGLHWRIVNWECKWQGKS